MVYKEVAYIYIYKLRPHLSWASVQQAAVLFLPAVAKNMDLSPRQNPIYKYLYIDVYMYIYIYVYIVASIEVIVFLVVLHITHVFKVLCPYICMYIYIYNIYIVYIVYIYIYILYMYILYIYVYIIYIYLSSTISDPVIYIYIHLAVLQNALPDSSYAGYHHTPPRSYTTHKNATSMLQIKGTDLYIYIYIYM